MLNNSLISEDNQGEKNTSIKKFEAIGKMGKANKFVEIQIVELQTLR